MLSVETSEISGRHELLKCMMRWSGRVVAKWYANLLLEMDVRWQSPLPAGAKIIAANHPTTTDPFLLMGMAPEPIYVLINNICFKMPLLGTFLRYAGHVPVVEGKGQAAFDRAVQLLKDGRTVAIFPEGALSPLAGGCCPPRTGVARLALVSGAPVIPIGIDLWRECIRFRQARGGDQTETARWVLNGPYAVTAGQPMAFDGDVGDLAYVRSVSQRIMGQIMDMARLSVARLDASRMQA
jgi:1-acyl-sn-glycerol-3-phosphate acyltransferase